jgi:hypothetical protein
MEDVSFLLPMFSDRSERYALHNFEPDESLAFANEVARHTNLKADNAEEFLRRLVRYSQGNPAAIITMVKMAAQSRYRSADQIKLSPLYIDFRLNSGFGLSAMFLTSTAPGSANSSPRLPLCASRVEN